MSISTPGGYTLRAIAGAGDGSGLAVGAVSGVAVAPDGTVYASDPVFHRILAVSPGGSVSIAAGTLEGASGFLGDNVPASGSRLDSPQALLVETGTGVVFVADSGNGRVRYFAPGGRMYTLAGGGQSRENQVPHATFAHLDEPTGLAVDGARNLYISERGTGKVRWVSPSGEMSTFAQLTPGQVGAITSDHQERLWVADGGRVLRYRTTSGDGAPTVVYEASGAVITGLAYDQANSLYIYQTAVATPPGLTDTRLVRLPLDADRPPVTVGGRSDRGVEADYRATDAALPDATNWRFASNGHAALAIDLRRATSPTVISGALLVGSSYADEAGTRWGQLLRLDPME